jgi:hypothetical protein
MFHHSPYRALLDAAIEAVNEAAAAVLDLYDRHAAGTYTRATVLL